MRNFIFLALLFPLPALAGGDAVEAYVIGIGGLNPGHPTAEQTQAAAALLQRHAAEQKPLQIGYLGSGLAPDPQQKCLYHGTGMAVEASDTVMVYQDRREGLYPYLPNP